MKNQIGFRTTIDELKNEIEDWKSDYEHNLEFMKRLNGRSVE